jgi:subtilisin family serine protease
MLARLLLALALCLGPCSTALAQKLRIERAAELPRFSYHIDGALEQVVTDPASFARFAKDVRNDFESVLDRYEIADPATERQLRSVLAQIAVLEGRYDDASEHIELIRKLEDKPAAKLLSGLQLRAIVAARRKSPDGATPRFRQEVLRFMAGELGAMPYPVVENDVKWSKSREETLSETMVLGNVREKLQAVVTRAGGQISSELAPALVGARYVLTVRLPLKATMVEAYGGYIAANFVEKQDIWKARDVDLPAGRDYAPVKIAVWDSGVDTSLFPGRVALDETGKPALIAFDLRQDPSASPLVPLPAALQAKLPRLRTLIKGASDSRSNIDSPEASTYKQLLSNLTPDQYKPVVEEMRYAGNYSHGTHVAGVAMAGNPYARIVNARIEFESKLLPDPCMSDAMAQKSAANLRAVVDFFRKSGVRVVNMSWTEGATDIEYDLEVCGIGANPVERKAIARRYFELEKAALTEAMAAAPAILFVAAAGNANQDSTFAEVIPAGIVLPNVVAVGAVDKAGEEASFTSYGPTVKLHANGYQVESYLPGGERVALSGTSMSAPQVANLAGKMLAVDATLTPAQIIAIIVETAEKSADGRRMLIHPANALARVRTRKG